MLYELVIGSKFGNGSERKSAGNRAGGSYGGCAFMPSSAASLGSPVARQSPPSCFGCRLRGEAGTAGTYRLAIWPTLRWSPRCGLPAVLLASSAAISATLLALAFDPASMGSIGTRQEQLLPNLLPNSVARARLTGTKNVSRRRKAR